MSQTVNSKISYLEKVAMLSKRWWTLSDIMRYFDCTQSKAEKLRRKTWKDDSESHSKNFRGIVKTSSLFICCFGSTVEEELKSVDKEYDLITAALIKSREVELNG